MNTVTISPTKKINLNEEVFAKIGNERLLTAELYSLAKILLSVSAPL